MMITRTLKRSLGALCIAAAIAPVSAQAATTFNAILDSAQEVAPGGATNSPLGAFSGLEIVSTPTGLALNYSILFDPQIDFGPVLNDQFGPLDPANIADPATIGGTDATLLHIHNAPSGANGPVVYGIFNPYTDLDNDITVTELTVGTLFEGQWDFNEGLDAFLPELLSLQTGEESSLYFNLHTANDPAGLIRGQIIATNSLAAVPLPAGLPLLLTGIGLMAWLRKRA